MVDRLNGALPIEVRRAYEAAVAPDLAQAYEQALAEILRFAGLTPHAEGFVHTVLDHVIGGVEWVVEISNEYPHLARAVNTEEVVGMLLLHDAGEIFGGDLRRDLPDYNSNGSQRKKRRQFLAVLLGLLNVVEDEAHRSTMRDYYRRFEGQTGEDTNGDLRATETDDVTALFARLIDIMQGNYIAATEFFSFNKMDPEKLNPAYIARRLTVMLKETTVIYHRLLELLPAEAGQELIQWWQARLSEYVEQGYPAELLEVDSYTELDIFQSELRANITP